MKQVGLWAACLVAALAFPGCGSDGAPAASDSCARNSDCGGGLVCLFRTCTQACAADRDCAAGARCLRTSAGSGCVTPGVAACASSCPDGTTCASDQQCRASCVPTQVDCLSGQACVGAVCAGTDPTHDATAASLGLAGHGGFGGAAGTAGSSPSGGQGGATTGLGGHGGTLTAGGASGAVGDGGSSAGGASAGASSAGAAGVGMNGGNGGDVGGGAGASGAAGGSSGAGVGGSSGTGGGSAGAAGIPCGVVSTKTCTAAPVPVEQACNALRSAFCGALVRLTLITPSEVSLCMSSSTCADDPLAKEVLAGRVEYDDAAMGCCVDHFQNDAVFSPSPYLLEYVAFDPVCRAAIRGKTAPSGSCYLDMDCLDGYCDSTSTCPGTCTPWRAPGADCTLAYQCAPGTGCYGSHCLARQCLGGTCTETLDCGYGYACDPGTKTCQLPPGLGQPCHDNDCSPTIGFCHQTSILPGMCQARYQLHESGCGGESECVAGLACINGSCEKPKFQGQTCDSSTSFANCEDFTSCLPFSNTCEPNPTIGGNCVVGGLECTDGYCDSSGKCAPLKKVGDSCTIADECVSFSCDVMSHMCTSGCAPP